MKSYISRKFPLETRTTDQIFDSRSAERLIGSNCLQSWPFVTLRRRPPIELNSPQSFFGHDACSLETDRGRHFRARLCTFKDESAAKLAKWASLGEDRRVAGFFPHIGCS